MRTSDWCSDVCSSDLGRVAGVVEIDLVDLVDHLPDQRAIFHVVIGIFERGAHDARAITFRPFERPVLQLGEELIVYKIEQRIAGDAFGVGGPGRPAELSWDRDRKSTRLESSQ